MPKWTFEPGHTAAEFSVRHMMVTEVLERHVVHVIKNGMIYK